MARLAPAASPAVRGTKTKPVHTAKALPPAESSASAALAKSAEQFNFSGLMPELRNTIYAEIGKDAFTAMFDMPPAITRVNKKIRSEATGLICSTATIELDGSDGPDTCMAWIYALSDEALLGIKKVKFSSLRGEETALEALHSTFDAAISIDFSQAQPVTPTRGERPCIPSTQVRRKCEEISEALGVSAGFAVERRRFLSFALLVAYDW
ncbi:hypothetical protein B0A50_02306 [Salinomyces thailandicus]|uniref:Uncharacterized protein n=1 Tax=Salinomyces thailandicus TaxID=706561 RepID=A0A4V5N7V5_9PEZI|nr:hypothetical protein B0A50_02306 [Salinomyces thailandica]